MLVVGRDVLAIEPELLTDHLGRYAREHGHLVGRLESRGRVGAHVDDAHDGHVRAFRRATRPPSRNARIVRRVAVGGSLPSHST